MPRPWRKLALFGEYLIDNETWDFTPTSSVQSWRKANPRGRNPWIARNELTNCELGCLRGACDNMKSRPTDTLWCSCTRACVQVLAVVQRLKGKVSVPFQPTGRIDQIVESWLHENSSRVLLPRPSEVCLDRPFNCLQIRSCTYLAVMDWNPGVLIGIGSSLSCNCVFVVGSWTFLPRCCYSVLPQLRCRR